MVLTIVGAAFIVLSGFVEISLVLANGTGGTYLFGYSGTDALLFAIVALVAGLLIVACAVLLHLYPQRHEVLGALVIGLAFASLFTFVGGFFLGFLLSLLGGILAVTWRPTIPLLYYSPSPPVYRICPKCGRVLDLYARFCPLCGNPVA
jgi:Family of unknown function (DUF6114)/zinc-ribbon domain